MAWTDPNKTWTVGEVLTSADLNQYVRDQLDAVLPYGTTWQTYTPQLTATTTSPTLGSGSVQAGRFYRVGQLVVVHGLVTFGTSGTAAGSGTYLVSLPISASASLNDNHDAGGGHIVDASGPTENVVRATFNGTDRTTVRLFFHGGAAAVTHSSPWTWAASDRISLNLIYEAA